MVESSGKIGADEEKLRAILAERGLPAKLGASLNFTERKVHEVLCAAYNFKSGIVGLDMPKNALAKLGPEFRKLWTITPPQRTASGKLEVGFSLTAPAIKTTLKTALAKDAAIFKPKLNIVRLHESWASQLKVKPKAKEAPVADWTKAEDRARLHNRAVTEQILDGKTFNAQKDNPWARKHLKNRSQ